MIKPLASPLSLLAASICLASSGALAERVLEEIVVTAQKREQSLQDVPISVSAFTGEQLEEAVIQDIFDLQTNTPGLRANQNQNATSANYSIRGVGTSSQNFGLESSVGLYVDGVYRSRQSTMVNDMVDMEAVEVLRGPQGTLFGKNTPSGAVLFRTKAPDHETDGFARITGGNYNAVNLSAGANLSLIEDVLAVRGTVYSSQRDGYTDVEGFGSDVINDRDREGARLQALFTPNDDVSVRVIADYSEIDEVCCTALTYVDSVVAKGRTDAQGNPIPGTDSVLALLGGTVATGDQTDNYETTLNQLPVSTARDRGLSAEVKWDLNDDATFVSISAWRKYNSFDSIDSDFSDVDIIRTANDAHQESFSQELRLDYTGDKLNAVVGLYYFQQDLDLNYTLTGGDALDPYAGLAFGLDAFVQGMNAISAATGGLFPQAASAYPNDFEAFHTASQEHESWAIFGQFDYSVTDDIILTMGLRYTEEEKDLRTVFNESIGGEVWNAGPQTSLAQVGAAGVALGQLGADLAVGDPSKLFDPTFVGQFAPYTVAGWGGWLFPGLTPRDDVIAELTDEQITGTLKLAWQVNDNSMIYASYGTGYKSGGTNTDRIPLGFNPVFDAETSESFEVGAKLEFPDQALRINTAAHYTTVDDFQENTFAGNGFILQNAGELETYGAELDVFWKPADNTTITFAYAYTVADFKSFEKGNCWNAYSWHNGVADPGATPGEAFCDRSGDRVSMNPEHNGTLGIQQDFVLSDSLEGYIYGEYSFLSDMVLDANNDPFKVQDDYGLVNLRAGLSFTELDLDVTLWVRNALDENYKRTTFDVPVQSGKLMAYPSVPRTFGLTLNKAF